MDGMECNYVQFAKVSCDSNIKTTITLCCASSWSVKEYVLSALLHYREIELICYPSIKWMKCQLREQDFHTQKTLLSITAFSQNGRINAVEYATQISGSVTYWTHQPTPSAKSAQVSPLKMHKAQSGIALNLLSLASWSPHTSAVHSRDSCES